MKTPIIALVGNPNCGKTTLFNALTGARQHVGNWPGVTVEKKCGSCLIDGRRIEVIDLPGTYALADDTETSPDERIARGFIEAGEYDLIVNIVDAGNLERNLSLTLQLAEAGAPMLVALNMVDVAELKGLDVDAAALAKHLGCPVVPVAAAKNQGIAAFKAAIVRAIEEKPHACCAQSMLAATSAAGGSAADADIIRTTQRFDQACQIAEGVVSSSGRANRDLTGRIDAVVLNRWLGIPIFLLIMYLLFLFTILIGGAFIDFFDQAVGALLVDGFAVLLGTWGAPEWLTLILAKGIGGGVQTVATFIPIIGFLYLFLALIEDSGYMARGAFVMDRLMQWAGLPGKSFVPLVVGFGCNVPAIMATRTLEHRRDRLLTIAMAPFMSCGARLPVYVLISAAFFAESAQNVVFALYLTGIAFAMLTGLLLNRTLLKGEAAPALMELPPYLMPTLKSVLIHTWTRLAGFIVRAGRVIVPMVLILNVLNNIGTDGSFGNEDSDKSVLAAVGRSIAPAFAPLGLTEENWPATVGIFTGILAKEAVVGTLDATYKALAASDAAAAGDVPTEEEEAFDLAAKLADAFATIPQNLGDALGAWSDPLGLAVGDLSDQAAVAAEQEVDVATFGTMAERFAGAAGAFAYLLFILLYTPCAAALAAVYQESGMRWMIFVALWTFGLAYGSATLFYQAATFATHPASASAWIAGVMLALAAATLAMRHWANRNDAPLRPSACAGCNGGRCT